MHTIIIRSFQRFSQVFCFVSAVLFLTIPPQSYANTPPPSECELYFPDPACVNISASGGDDGSDFRMDSGRENILIGTAPQMNSTSVHASAISARTAEAAADESASITVGEENRVPDWSGVWRDTGILIGSQFVAAGLIYIMPESVSNWSDEQKKNSFKKYADNFVDPVMDKDKFYINYILHPYWGATYYIRARERGLDKIPSFVYSALISATYEFGVECFFEKPSIQDLIVTPIVGSLLGAFIFEPWRESIKLKQELRWYDHAALIVTDPIGVLSLGIEKMFGIKSTIMVDYSVPQLQKRSSGTAIASNGNRIGISVKFPFN